MNIVTASLFNLAGPDLIIIFVIVLLLFGAKKLPELARGLGQAVREFSKAKDEFEREITHPTYEPPKQEQISAPQPAEHLAQAQSAVSAESAPSTPADVPVVETPAPAPASSGSDTEQKPA